MSPRKPSTPHGWHQPRGDHGHLVTIHGDAIGGDDGAEVGDGEGPKGALRPLEEEAMCLHCREDKSHVLKVLGP